MNVIIYPLSLKDSLVDSPFHSASMFSDKLPVNVNEYTLYFMSQLSLAFS